MFYIYKPKTKEYLRETTGQENPLKSGDFLTPPFSTTVAPLPSGVNESCVFNGTAWEIKKDFRGSNYWLKVDASKVIFALGDSADATMTSLEPLVDSPEWDGLKWVESQNSLDAKAKSLKMEALSSITVTTTAGNTFDGDDVARQDMLSAIDASITLNLTENNWKLADNTWKIITLAELREASALAIQAKGVILAS